MIPFSPPRIDQKIIDAVTETLKSGWITTGPKTKLFEKRLTEYTGARSTLCVNSCSAGLELVLRWFGVKDGDEVIVPAYTYSATANVVIHCGAKPVMIDSGKDFNIDVGKLQEAITEKTKVIIPVDIAGYPCDYDQIMELINRKDIREKFNAAHENQEKLKRILVLADAAHSIGAAHKNRKTGTLADISVFSFHAVKNLTTAEGGGISLNLPLQFDNQAIYNQLNILSLHGQTKDALAKSKLGGWRYDIVEAGYKCNFTDIQASIGLVELKRYDSDMLVKRRDIFDRYTHAFAKKEWAETPPYEDTEKISSYHVYVLRIIGIQEKTRDRIIDRIYEKQVAVNVHFVPLPLMSYYCKLGYKIDDYPVAYDNYARAISLPVYYDLSKEQIETVIQTVIESVEEFM